jgi:hypothetical protein
MQNPLTSLLEIMHGTNITPNNRLMEQYNIQSRKTGNQTGHNAHNPAYYFILSFVCLAFFACEKTIEIKTSYQKQLVCTGFAGNDGKTMVYLQITHPPLEWGFDTTIIDANILLLNNSKVTEGLIPRDFNFYELPQTTPFSEGDSLSIWIDTPLFGLSYSSNVVMPKTIPIDSARIIQTNGPSQIQVFFTDPPGRNFYAIKKEWITEAGIVPQDYLLDYGNVFNDELAKNGQMIITEQIYHSHRINGENYPLQKARIILFHLSEPAYRFFSSLYQSEGELGDLFEEPTIIYSNIHNGIGVFATYATDTLTIDFNP